MNALLSSTTLQLLSTFGAIWLSWRIWRFTIRPSFRPNEPKELPYWIPFIGHAAASFQDTNALIAKGRKYFEKSGEPFIITVAGNSIYIPTSPDDVNTVWNKPKAISARPTLVEVYGLMRIGEKSREALEDVHENAKYNEGMGKPLDPIEMVSELHRQSLRNGPKGPRLDEMLSNSTIPAISKKLEFEQEVNPNGPFIVSLSEVCDDLFIGMGADTWFGPKLRELEPDLVNTFKRWEYYNWQLMLQVPHFFAKEMLAAKQTLTDAFNRYYKTPRNERDGARYFVTALEDMLREAGLTDSELGKFLLPHYWAIFDNVHKISFWAIAHLVHNPSLLQTICKEVSPAVQGDKVNETYLQEQCPNLQALINETLRLTVHTALVRGVVEPTVIGGKLLQPGHKIILPISELHFNNEAWGKNADSFAPNRFVENPKLAKSLAFRPFGGGTTQCPGRFYARRAISAFIALLVSRYELEAESESFPTADPSRPSPGAILMGEDQDVKLRCTPRKQ